VSGAYCWSMICSDLPSPAEASNHTVGLAKGFAQAGNRKPLFGIMLYAVGRMRMNAWRRHSATSLPSWL